MNTRALKPRERNSRYDGGLTDFLKRLPQQERATEELRWHRAQMRNWALNWRDRHIHAAALDESPEAIGKTDLFFAKMYRDESRKVGAR